MNIENIIARLPAGLPRYTSYPPANHFQAGVGRSLSTAFVNAVEAAPHVSVYMHIPFCDRLCWFCGCHTKHTLRYEPIQAYVQSLIGEIGIWGSKLAKKPAMSRLHLGGGSPSLLREAELKALREALESVFAFNADTEISVEIDPSDIGEGQIENLARFGLTRASIGVQDFDPAVQAAINRPQSFEATRDVVQALRRAGVTSVNIDALYGLPLQTLERLQQTISQVISLTPDRIALFGYAHVPWLKTHQRMIRDEDLPDTPARYVQARTASEDIQAAGYQAIGIDHFALPNDSLAVATREGRLHRNFQGYTDDTASVLLPLGASSVGRFEDGYIQNEVPTGQYLSRIEAGELPFSRGLALVAEDHVRSFIIERLMCDYAFCLSEVQSRFGAQSRAALAHGHKVADEMLPDLCEISDGMFKVKPDAWPLVRVVASKFDTWIVETAEKPQYSKAV